MLFFTRFIVYDTILIVLFARLNTSLLALSIKHHIRCSIFIVNAVVFLTALKINALKRIIDVKTSQSLFNIIINCGIYLNG